VPLDALTLTAVTSELAGILIGGKVEKIYQPESVELHLVIRTLRDGTCRLLISANGSRTRLHLTGCAKENPPAPPMFCMLLRKHLSGAKLVALTQEPAERVVHLDFSVFDEMGLPSRKRLTAELMSRRPNLLFIDGENRITECLKRTDTDITSDRTLLPGLFYRLPVQPEKQNPLTMTAADWFAFWLHAHGNAVDFLLSGAAGFSPLLAREAVYRAVGDAASAVDDGNRTKLADGCFVFFSDIANGRVTPVLLTEHGKPKDISCVLIQHDSSKTVLQADSFSGLLDSFFTAEDSTAHLHRKAQGLIKTAKNNRDRAVRKLSVLQKEWQETQNRDTLRVQGELLTANFHRIQKGQSAVTLDDYYTDTQRTIVLDPTKTPQQNAAKFFKEYAKAKNAESVLTEQQHNAAADAEYWESVLEAIDRCTAESELNEIRSELQPRPVAKGRKKPPVSRPHLFVSSSGLRIWAGRNNTQNDTLTLRTAGKNDWWLHTQKIPGAHVIIESRGERPDAQTFWEAAIIAATLSQAKNGVKVPVDYTQVKHVKKPSRAKPGMVIYDKFKTIFADPDEGLLDRLRSAV
jgi:predicted ribosome quality control (RQC) complex YloA/Tae2 family protein